MSNSVQPHRQQPTRLPHPWDSPGKNTGVGCHFLLQCMKVKSESEVAQSCPTLSDSMDCSLPGSSVHMIFQARVLEWGAIAFSQVCLLHKPNYTNPDLQGLQLTSKLFLQQASKQCILIAKVSNHMCLTVIFSPPSFEHIKIYIICKPR